MSGFPAPLRWIPAVGMMGLIFFLSSLPASRLPHFGPWSTVFEKGGHALGYALLGLAYYYALPRRLSIGYRWATALFMALLFALSDEYHQSFVQGRGSELGDVAVDGIGAALALALGAGYSANSSSKSKSRS